MANVAHSTLTGADLHESKGTAAATVNQVFVADGAGSGGYSKLTAASLTGTGNPFGAQLLHLQETTGLNTAAVAMSAATKRAVNTVVTNEISGASLSSNQITLPAGTYYIQAELANYGNGYQIANAAYLYDTTAATTILQGPLGYAPASSVYSIGYSGGGNITAYNATITVGLIALVGRFTLAAPHVLEIRSVISTNAGTYITGQTTNVHSNIQIFKVA